ncbi:GntR family transcriptional regulator [Sphingomonas sp. PL-96]|uniref:GntR family transcriptional regulator n=1 Tax=Sphingomonas sp. PL-96 TaxID=2887201 RepID=UPI002B4BB82B|nr:GntR family transcriptional regulator [Sphingomonas sp. PL-96]MCC2977132.1 GntR family transcriptional regulator [Sphingomonas sp. PL-96]
MNAGPVAERVHEALRHMILNRVVRPGARLDPAALSDVLAASATPVREALFVLHGEGLVDLRPGGGFLVPMVDAPALADLYAWSDELLGLILRSADLPALAASGMATDPSADGTERTAWLVARLAGASPNEEHRRAARDVNARLHAARLVEPTCLAGIEEELARLVASAAVADAGQLRAGWRLYHRRRQRAAPAIVRALLRD